MSCNKYILNIYPIYHLSRIETYQIPRIIYLDLSTGNYNIIKLKQTNTGGKMLEWEGPKLTSSHSYMETAGTSGQLTLKMT